MNIKLGFPLSPNGTPFTPKTQGGTIDDTFYHYMVPKYFVANQLVFPTVGNYNSDLEYVYAVFSGNPPGQNTLNAVNAAIHATLTAGGGSGGTGTGDGTGTMPTATMDPMTVVLIAVGAYIAWRMFA